MELYLISLNLDYDLNFCFDDVEKIMNERLADRMMAAKNE